MLCTFSSISSAALTPIPDFCLCGPGCRLFSSVRRILCPDSNLDRLQVRPCRSLSSLYAELTARLSLSSSSSTELSFVRASSRPTSRELRLSTSKICILQNLTRFFHFTKRCS